MSQCYQKYDLNEKTCKFVKKCPDGKIRNESFRCVKAPLNKQTYLKEKIKKGKINAEERLRGRTEILKNIFKSKTDEWLKLEDSNIRDKLKRIRTQTVKRGFDNITQNIDSLMKKVENYSKPRRTRRTKPERRSVNFSLGEISNTEDLRPSRSFNSKEVNLNEPNTHLEEQTRLNSPDSPLRTNPNEETLSKYSKAVSGMFNTLDLSKLNGMTRRKPRSKKPVGTSMNAKPTKPRKSRAKRARVSGSP